MRSAAGGETGAPRSQRGTRLKATTERAFLDPGANAGCLKRLVLLCLQCGTCHSLIRTKAAIEVTPYGLACRGRQASQEVHLAAAPPSGSGSNIAMTGHIREFLHGLT